MARTRIEVTEDLASVRASIRSAESAQSYGTGLGNNRTMADLTTLYKRENDLIAERADLDAGGGYGGMTRTVGRMAR